VTVTGIKESRDRWTQGPLPAKYPLAVVCQIPNLSRNRSLSKLTAKLQKKPVTLAQTRRNEHPAMIIKTDQTVIEERIEIGGKQQAVGGVKALPIGRLPPRLNVRSSENGLDGASDDCTATPVF
jgi:hypothetical protein